VRVVDKNCRQIIVFLKQTAPANEALVFVIENIRPDQQLNQGWNSNSHYGAKKLGCFTSIQ